MRKDIKKSSYYVWFLGAQESKGLRGVEFIVPVVKNLVLRERDVEPFKVTLQVSHKGLKIIQNILPPSATPGALPGGKAAKPAKPEVVKHFIPHHAVTCVLQDEDIVACILLLYNPVTKCPVHVHAYRCDSVETAEILRGQLQTLIERPDNQKKLNEIEARLRAKGLLAAPARERDVRPALPVAGAPAPRRALNGGGSDGRSTSTRESESSGGSSSERLSGVGQQERIASLYDSLAAELREKLGAGPASSSEKPRPAHAPILLPPRDYDTVHRQKGNLTAIDLRRCMNANIVGVNAKNAAAGAATATGGTGPGRGSSGGSSGIGSDHAPSPDQQDADHDGRFLDHQSSSDTGGTLSMWTNHLLRKLYSDSTNIRNNNDVISGDEDWTEQPSEDSLFLVQPSASRSAGGGSWRGPGADLSLPRARRVHSSGSGGGGTSGSGGARHHAPPPAASPTPAAPAPYRRPGGGGGGSSGGRRQTPEERQRSPSPSERSNGAGSGGVNGVSPRDRFKDAKEKFLLLEKERLEEQQRLERLERRGPPPPQHHAQAPGRPTSRSPEEPPISPAVHPVAGRRFRAGSWSRSRVSDEEEREERVEGRGGAPPPGRFYPRSHHGLLPHAAPADDDDFDLRAVDDDDDEVFDARLRSRSASNLARRDSHGTPRLAHIADEEIRDVRRDRREAPLQRSDPRPAPRYHHAPPSQHPQHLQHHPRHPAPLREHREHRDLREHRDVPRDVPRDVAREHREVVRDVPRDVVREHREVARDHRDVRELSEHRGRRPLYDDFGPEEYSPERSPARDRLLSPTRGPRPAPRAAAYHDDIPLERYRSPAQRGGGGGGGPQPAPRQRAPPPASEPRDASPERRYPKRRSMFDALEEERRRSSNELAREFKRRSYQEGVLLGGGGQPDGYPGYQELPERERYPGLDRESARGHHGSGQPRAAAPAGYRHSYAEGPLHHELLHRTSSSVSSGRVGIAAVHPY